MIKLNHIWLFCLFTLLGLGCTEQPSKSIKVSPSREMSKKNKYPISLAQWSVHVPYLKGELDPLEFPAYAAELGFDGVEYVNQLYAPYYEENPTVQVPKLAHMLKEKADAAGVKSVLMMTDHLGDLANPDEKARTQAIEEHKLWIDACKIMSCPAMRVNAFGQGSREEMKEGMIMSLKALAAYGKTQGVKVLIENHGGYSSDPYWLDEVCKTVDSPYGGTLPDFGNWCMRWKDGVQWQRPCEETFPDKYKGIALMMPYAGGVSAKSYAFDDEGNETTIDYAQMLKIVKASGFEGYIGVEYESEAEDPKPGILATKRLIEKHL